MKIKKAKIIKNILPRMVNEYKKYEEGITMSYNDFSDEKAKAAENTPKAAVNSGKEGVVEITVAPEEQFDSDVIKLCKTYSFEGKTISTIDVSGLADMNAIQLEKAESVYRKIAKTPISSPETTLTYALAATHIMTGLPIEFLQRLKARDAIALKNKMVTFLYGSDEEE